jgi:hypothetical protein
MLNEPLLTGVARLWLLSCQVLVLQTVVLSFAVSRQVINATCEATLLTVDLSTWCPQGISDLFTSFHILLSAGLLAD